MAAQARTAGEAMRRGTEVGHVRRTATLAEPIVLGKKVVSIVVTPKNETGSCAGQKPVLGQFGWALLDSNQ
jgi:hypothetical protein